MPWTGLLKALLKRATRRESFIGEPDPSGRFEVLLVDRAPAGLKASWRTRGGESPRARTQASGPLADRRFTQDLARQQVAVDLAGALDHPSDAQCPKPALERKLLGHPHPAQDLHHRID